MGDWLLNLPVPWMALIVFLTTYLMAAGVYLIVTRLAVDERARAFKAVSPGMLPPLGIIFGLLVGFIAPLSATNGRDTRPTLTLPGMRPRRIIYAMVNRKRSDARLRISSSHMTQSPRCVSWPSCKTR
jgi:hypothetical protein